MRPGLVDDLADLREALRHLPGRHDQMSHGRGHGGLAAKLKELVPDNQPDDALTLPGGRYFDWATDEDGIRTFEAGNGEDAVAVSMAPADMQQLASALSVTLLRNTASPPDADDRHSLLVASLMSAGQHGGVHLGNVDDIDETGRYLDWSGRDADGNYELEVGSDDEAAIIPVSPDEMAQLHAQLVRTLLGDE